MKEISLTQGKVALVDDADFDWLNQWNWVADLHHSGGWYARRSYRVGPRKIGKSVGVKMHRLIMNITDPGVPVDHADGNGLNNQRENLRFASWRQNAANRPKWRKPCSSSYKGVGWHKKTSKWQAYISVNYKRQYIGLFTDELDAAQAYNWAAALHFGDFAKLNEKEINGSLE